MLFKMQSGDYIVVYENVIGSMSCDIILYIYWEDYMNISSGVKIIFNHVVYEIKKMLDCVSGDKWLIW